MSLRVRLALAFGYVLLFSLIALEVPLTLNFSRRVDSETKAQAAAGAHGVAAAASDELRHPQTLTNLAQEQARELGGRVLVVNAAGRVLVDSDGAAANGASYGSRPEIARALRGVVTQGTRHSDTLHTDLLYTAVPIVKAGRTIGAVRVTQSVKAVNSQVRRDIFALIGLGGAVLLVGVGLGWGIAGSLSRPLRELAGTARRVARGDLEARASAVGSTEHAEVATAFNEMTDRLVRSLNAQREFLANASHQLRTPLTGLRLRLESAGLKAGDADLEDRVAAEDSDRLARLLSDLQRDLAASERETERLAKLLADLLHLAGDGQPRPAVAPTSLDTIAQHAIERWRDRAELDGHRLELVGNGEPYVLAATGDLETMVDNLVENALNYSDADTPIELDWGQDGDDAFIAVLDRGPGLDETEAERVFERFYRGSASREGRVLGTGLGLTIVETLAARWNARATIATRAGGGARAEIRFPAADPPSAHGSTEPAVTTPGVVS